MSATKQTDTAEKQKRLGSAVDSYQKALQLKQAAINDKDPNATRTLAAYYNNLADAYSRAGRIDDSVKTYQLAALADPTGAAQSYFNIGRFSPMRVMPMPSSPSISASRRIPPGPKLTTRRE